MTKKTTLSPAAQSRENAKAVLEQEAAAKENEKAVYEAAQRELAEKARAEEEERKRQAVYVGENLYPLLRKMIEEAERRGVFKLETTFEVVLSRLDDVPRYMLDNERCGSHAFNNVAKKLR